MAELGCKPQKHKKKKKKPAVLPAYVRSSNSDHLADFQTSTSCTVSTVVYSFGSNVMVGQMLEGCWWSGSVTTAVNCR